MINRFCSCIMTWAILALLFFSAGCKSNDTLINTAGKPGDRIVLKTDIIDDQIWWVFGRRPAKLYLKVSSSSSPDFYFLYPINVGDSSSGSRTKRFITPYVLGEHKSGLLTLELLRDKSFSKEEEELLVNAAKLGSSILCDGVNYLLMSQECTFQIDSNTKGEIENLSKDTVRVIIKEANLHKFQPYGARDVVVSTAATYPIVTNPITIVDDKKNARCDIRLELLSLDKK